MLASTVTAEGPLRDMIKIIWRMVKPMSGTAEYKLGLFFTASGTCKNYICTTSPMFQLFPRPFQIHSMSVQWSSGFSPIIFLLFFPLKPLSLPHNLPPTSSTFPWPPPSLHTLARIYFSFFQSIKFYLNVSVLHQLKASALGKHSADWIVKIETWLGNQITIGGKGCTGEY